MNKRSTLLRKPFNIETKQIGDRLNRKIYYEYLVNDFDIISELFWKLNTDRLKGAIIEKFRNNSWQTHTKYDTICILSHINSNQSFKARSIALYHEW